MNVSSNSSTGSLLYCGCKSIAEPHNQMVMIPEQFQKNMFFANKAYPGMWNDSIFFFVYGYGII